MNKIETSMRKLTLIIATLAMPFLCNAQRYYQFSDGSTISRQFIDFLAIIVIIFLVIKFITSIIKYRMDYRLKSKMMDKGVSEKIVEQFLQPQSEDSKNSSMKWFLLLAGVGIGLIVLDWFLPIGIHSVAIMSLSIALSFLGYYYFLKRTEN